MESTEEKGARVNLRLTDGQYELMKKLGGALGIELDSQCAKHFFLLGIQASMSTLATQQGNQMLDIFRAAMQQSAASDAEQMDLVTEASRARA